MFLPVHIFRSFDASFAEKIAMLNVYFFIDSPSGLSPVAADLFSEATPAQQSWRYRSMYSLWDAGRGSIIETVNHYLFECQAYVEEQYDMDRALGRASRDFKGILASLDKIKELLKFVGRTSRFKMTLGDAIGDVSHLEPEEG